MVSYFVSCYISVLASRNDDVAIPPLYLARALTEIFRDVHT
jgi:hypothetical protein